MKSIITRILGVMMAVGLMASCGSTEEVDYTATPLATIAIVNDTQRTLIFDHNIFGLVEAVEVQPGCFVSATYWVYADLGIRGEKMGWYVLNSLNERHYFQVYTTDGELLKKWERGACDPTVKTPFVIDYYDYSVEELELHHSWYFSIDEELLSQAK